MNTPSTSSLRVQDLCCEYQLNPLGIDVKEPRLSWKLSSDRRGASQSAYQIQVSDGRGELWNSGKVLSHQSIHIPYRGPALRSRQRYTWRVRVWDEHDRPSAWSAAGWWEMGLLQATDWQALWIEPDWEEDPAVSNPCPYLRTTFTLREQVISARLYVTAHGLYDVSLNGQRVGDAYFTPGYTSYPHRLQYQVYDVGELVRAGENALGVILGDGWYRGEVGVFSHRNVYGERLGLLLQLHVLSADGSEQIVTSGQQWKASTGPILASDLKEGECYDARLEMPGWSEANFDASDWRGVRIADYPLDNLVTTIGPVVRREERFVPVQILTTPAGETVVDMGQNFAGVVQLKVRGPAGTTIRLHHGETLDRHGNFTMEHLALGSLLPSPAQEVRYTLKGEGEEVYTPFFTTHGFRYVKVEGFPGVPTRENFTGIALYSDLPETGTFQCSHPLLNQLHHNILWSQKSNFLEIPTDCPTRERAGWTGDAQIFAATGSFLMQTASFFTKWLRDLAAEQEASGMVGNIVPSPEQGLPRAENPITRLNGAAGWGDAAIIVPWTLYWCFGDQRILEEQYASMKAWVEYERQQAQNKYGPEGYTDPRYLEREPLAHERYLWDTNFHWGEWLEPNDPLPGMLNTEWTARTRQLLSAPHIATAFFAHSARLLAEISRILGKEDEMREYSTLHLRIKEAYSAEFVENDGRLRPDRQASYVRALAFDLLPEPLRAAAIQRLVELVQSADAHLATGFLSTPYLCPVLGDNGHLDLAYTLLLQETPPAWLYAVKKGATTIWESWDGIDEEGNPHYSLNHYAYGAIGNWLYQVVAGIAPGAPGYQHIMFRPQPGGGLTFASATYQSLYGKIASSWQIDGERFHLTVTVPPNATATVVIPARLGKHITEGGVALESTAGIRGVKREQKATSIEIGSGRYRFTASHHF
jgi:alpha-L-rhamnosidase